MTHFHPFAQSVVGLSGDGLLRGEDALYLCPVVGNAVLLEFVADGVDYPIGQQTEEEVCVRVLIALVVYGAQFKIRLQLAVARLNFTNKIVVFPGRTLVKRTDVGAQEVRGQRIIPVGRR